MPLVRFCHLKHGARSGRRREPLRNLMAQDACTGRDGTVVIRYSALPCDHKNKPLTLRLSFKDEGRERTVRRCRRQTVQVDPGFRLGFAARHPLEGLFVHRHGGGRQDIGERSNQVMPRRRSIGSLAQSKLGHFFQHLRRWPLWRARFFDWFCGLEGVSQRCRRPSDAVPKCFLFRTQSSRFLSGHRIEVRGATRRWRPESSSDRRRP